MQEEAEGKKMIYNFKALYGLFTICKTMTVDKPDELKTNEKFEIIKFNEEILLFKMTDYKLSYHIKYLILLIQLILLLPM